MPFMLIQSAPRSGLSQDIIGYRFQMQSIQCNNMLDDGSVFVFFLGRTMRTMVQLMLMSDGVKCNIIKTL